MEKSIISPLCSALVAPGLGQIINGQVKKGLFILGSVLVLIIAATIRMYLHVKEALKGLAVNELYPEMLISRFKAQNHTFLWCLVFIFAVLWVYSVWDAFVEGRKLDLRQGKNEIISNR